jgi:3-methyladenine DNA glycosylase AlkD
LIQKACGWMLREAWKRNEEIIINFLEKYYKIMPRTMLRYALEKLNKEKKDFFMGR